MNNITISYATCKGYDSKLYIRKIIIKPQIRMFKREVIPQTSQFQ